MSKEPRVVKGRKMCEKKIKRVRNEMYEISNIDFIREKIKLDFQINM